MVESYRTECGPRPRVVAYLGPLDEEGRLGVQQAVTQPAAGKQRPLFESEGSDQQRRWMTVNTAAVRVENWVQFGRPWRGLELIKKIGLDQFLTK